MLTKEDLQMLRAIIKEETEPINKRLDKIEERLDTIEENTEITREATNYLLDLLEGKETAIKKLM